MTIANIEREVREIRDQYSICGLESILNAVAYCYKDHEFVDKDYMMDLFSQCIDRASKED